MSHIFLDRRGGRLALYLNGDLQFDAADERLYHEPLALVPVALARARRPARALRVLVLGGGDGLALREVLRIPGVAEAHVVDRDAEVLRLATTELADLNAGALRDPRTRVHQADARRFLDEARDFDVMIYDLTYPRDVGAAALLSVPVFSRVRQALTPTGVLAVNAVSPESTPQAFGCIAATLGAAGLAARPYAFELPSFRAEGYGRWGFLFASATPIEDAELLALDGFTRLLDGGAFPLAAEDAMRVAANRTDELLYYIANGAPLDWTGPLRLLRFAGPAPATGPRLTAAHGFTRWLRQPAGRRSLEDLLGCLPLAQRGITRQIVLDWSQHAEMLLRELDLRAFVDRALRRAASLPAAWGRELRELSERLREGLPSMDDLLHRAYRVFAVFLLVMLAANLFFPDNLYAKGTSSGGGDAAMHFSSPGPTSPFRYRSYSGSQTSYPYSSRIRDSQGAEYPAESLVFSDAASGPKPISALLALTRELRLLESGAVAYWAAVPGYQFLLSPGRLQALTPAGREILALYPGAPVLDETINTLAAQGPLIDKAIADHRRWLDWVRWGGIFPGGGAATSELDELERIRAALATAREAWTAPVTRPTPALDRAWSSIFPGVFLVPRRPGQSTLGAVLVMADGSLHRRSLAPPPVLAEDDRLLFWILYHRLTTQGDRGLGPVVREWEQAYGASLGLGKAQLR